MAKKQVNKEPIPKFEIIHNGKVVKIITGFSRIDAEEAKFGEKCRKQKFEEIQSSSSGSHGYSIYFNEDNLETRIFAWREITPFVDKKGNIIYYGDRLKDDYGNVYILSQHPSFSDEDKPYYIRGERDYQVNVTAKEIKKSFTVVREVYPKIPSFKEDK